MSNLKVIAFYLPQFHPTIDNDRWYGKGFTEWTNVGKSRPLFRGHYQPHVPADLGYYDLRVPEVRSQQVQLAKEAGIYGFCYWHYWFGNGKRELELPFNEVVRTGQPDFPFMLAWANETWKGLDFGVGNRSILLEQSYPGIADYKQHFDTVLPAFLDSRYIRIEGKPVFMIYKPHLLPNASEFIKLWQQWAHDAGLPGIFFIAHHQREAEQGRKEIDSYNLFRSNGFDAVNFTRLHDKIEHRSKIKRLINSLCRRVLNMPIRIQYSTAIKSFSLDIDSKENVYPTLIPNWDHTPRSGKYGFVFTNSSPDLFAKHVRQVFNVVKQKSEANQITFLKSWNEWGEGNYMEPDLKYGKGYIEALRRELDRIS